MADTFPWLASRNVAVPPALEALYRAMPSGADLGTVRLLSAEELARPGLGPVPIPLLPIAVGGERDAFALYLPFEQAPRPAAVCAVDLETGAYAPISSSLRGFGAWLLLLRRAQASLPAGPGFAVRELLQDTSRDAERLAAALGLESLLKVPVEPDAAFLAGSLAEVEPGAPWACSILAGLEEQPEQALRRLSPALLEAPFSAGLLFQAAQLYRARADAPRAARALFAALSRLEPNLQAVPHQLDQPDEEGQFRPFDVASAFRQLSASPKDAPQGARTSAVWLYLAQALADGGELRPEAGAAIEAARRRGLGGDLPGGRWILHLALGARFDDPEARRALAGELALTYRLAGCRWHEERCLELSQG